MSITHIFCESDRDQRCGQALYALGVIFGCCQHMVQHKQICTTMKDRERFGLLANLRRQSAQREFYASVKRILTVTGISSIQFGHQVVEILGCCSHALFGKLTGQQLESACVAVHRINQLFNLLWRATRIVSLRLESFLLHDLADERDRVCASQSAKPNVSSRMIKSR